MESDDKSIISHTRNIWQYNSFVLVCTFSWRKTMSATSHAQYLRAAFRLCIFPTLTVSICGKVKRPPLAANKSSLAISPQMFYFVFFRIFFPIYRTTRAFCTITCLSSIREVTPVSAHFLSQQPTHKWKRGPHYRPAPNKNLKIRLGLRVLGLAKRGRTLFHALSSCGPLPGLRYSRFLKFSQYLSGRVFSYSGVSNAGR